MSASTADVIPLRATLLPRHRSHLRRWLKAGERMGLHDAQVVASDADRPVGPRRVVVWVRENADPAYLIEPAGMRWTVTDHLRQNRLGCFPSFEAALHCIRPVLPLAASAAA